MKKKIWDKKIAIKLALKENIILNNIHWKIIFYVRNFYFKNKVFPNTRNILFFLNKKKNYFDSIFLFKLFPKGIIKQCSKIACLPDYVSCF